MKKLLLILFCTPLLLASMCEDDDDKIVVPCSEQAVFGLNIQIQDAATQEFITGVTVTAQDGTYSETLEPVMPGTPPSYAGAFERAGTYIITASKPGYVNYVSSPITVTANECHVIQQSVNIQLQPQ
ncbi:MAG: carboxypeptidase regulatory-like domain-containing protein [Sphingobacteriales bacterium]|nr:MAG: carboxypeptidase regulatory-like domain-containing protein [Sphingobacteriales bacterium]